MVPQEILAEYDAMPSSLMRSLIFAKAVTGQAYLPPAGKKIKVGLAGIPSMSRTNLYILDHALQLFFNATFRASFRQC